MAVLRYVSDHIEHVIGGLVVLFLLTSILLLIRNINQKEQPAEGSGRTNADDLDIGAIESAMKRVLAAQGVVGVANLSGAGASQASAHASSGSSTTSESTASGTLDAGSASQLAEALKERDVKVQDLAREIDRLTTEVATSKTLAGGGGGSDGKVAELQTKIEELQARLSEYEIIEDDIADLSLFKEENAQLRTELEALKSQIGSGNVVASPVAPVIAEEVVATPVAPETDEEDVFTTALLEEAQVLAESPAVEVESAGPVESAAPKVVSQDEIDALFALAPKEAKTEDEDVASLAATGDELAELIESLDSPEVAPEVVSADSSIFEGDLDTEKMLSEVENLSDSSESEDILEGSLDTEKLLAEMDSIGTKPAAPGPATTAPAKPVVPPELFNPEEEQVGEDDLLAEFKDPTDGGQR